MQRSLKWTLMVRVGVIVAAVLLINAIIAGYFFKREFVKRIQAQSEAITNDIIEDARQSLSAFGATKGFTDFLNKWLKDMVVSHEYLLDAAFVDPAGKYVAHSEIQRIGELAPQEVLKNLGESEIEPVGTSEGYITIVPINDSEGKPISYLMFIFDSREYTDPMRRMTGWLIAMVLASLGAIYVMFEILVARRVAKPIKKLSEYTTVVSEGDLSSNVEVGGVEEIAALAIAFNAMTGNFREMIGKIKVVSESFTDNCQRLFSLSGEVHESSRHQISTLNGANEAVRKMETSVEDIAKQIEELNLLSQNASASILEMAASIGEVDSNVDNLVRMVDEIASSILEITQSIRQVSAGVESLSREADNTASSIAQMKTTLSQVDDGASKSAELSVQVAETAESGIRSIDDAQVGMAAIRAAAEGATDSISRLGERSGKIGKILGVINKIAEETNLLALNAAIIAAEAGEHGRGFNVVANEIQMLAEKTTLQTKEIDALIKDVHKETKGSVDKVREVLHSVEDGEKLTSNTAEILQQIVKVSNDAKSLAQQIARATDEQAQGVKRVAMGSERVSGEVGRISKAIKEQALGAAKIMDAIEKIRDLARSVQSATTEQNEGSKSISRTTEQVRDSVTLINQRTDRHRHEAGLVSDIVARNLQIVEENDHRVQEMESGVEKLLAHTAGLNDEVRRFHVRKND